MAGPFDIILLWGQSNMTWGYFIGPMPVGPNLYGLKQNGTVVTATQPLDFTSMPAGATFASWGFLFARDYYIPYGLNAGRDVLLVPLAKPGTGFSGHLEVGGAEYNANLALINLAMAAGSDPTHNKIVMMLGSHGEEDVGDSTAPIGKYVTLAPEAGYTAYFSETCTDLHANVTGGFSQVPILLAGMPPHTVYNPTTPFSPNYPSGIGNSADGTDHHNAAGIPIQNAFINMGSNIPNPYAFVDPINPTVCQVQAAVNPFSSLYYIHYSFASHQQLAHRAFKQYLRLKGLGTPITVGWS